VHYKLYRSTDNENYSLLATIEDINSNYYIDKTVEGGQKYYYYVTAGDDLGHYSDNSQTVSAVPGSQPIDTVPPSISALGNQSPGASSVVISWLTDEVSNSAVLFGTDNSCPNVQAATGYETNHAITLVGLTPNTGIITKCVRAILRATARKAKRCHLLR